MSSVSLSKSPRVTAAAPRRASKGMKERYARAVAVNDQDRSAVVQGATNPAVFWKVVMLLAMALSVYNAIGTALFGSDWLFAYWNALDYWCTGGYCC